MTHRELRLSQRPFSLIVLMGKYLNVDWLSMFSGKIRRKTPVLCGIAGIVKVTLSHHGVRCQNTIESTILFTGIRRH